MESREPYRQHLLEKYPKMTRDPRWAMYPETILELGTSGRLIRIDLREPLSEAHIDALRSLPIAAPFGVVTAANPIGRQLSPEENRGRFEALRMRLSSSVFPHMEADGLSPDECHREAGCAVHAPREEVGRLANDFEQSAFFWFDGSSFWLVDTSEQSRALRLPA